MRTVLSGKVDVLPVLAFVVAAIIAQVHLQSSWIFQQEGTMDLWRIALPMVTVITNFIIRLPIFPRQITVNGETHFRMEQLPLKLNHLN